MKSKFKYHQVVEQAQFEYKVDGFYFQSDQIINIPYNIQALVYPNDGTDDDVEYPIYHTGSVVDDLGAELDNPGSQEPQDHISGGKFNLTLNQDFFDNTQAMETFLQNLKTGHVIQELI